MNDYRTYCVRSVFTHLGLWQWTLYDCSWHHFFTHSQPLKCSQMCSIDIFVNLQPVGWNLKAELFDRHVGGSFWRNQNLTDVYNSTARKFINGWWWISGWRRDKHFSVIRKLMVVNAKWLNEFPQRRKHVSRKQYLTGPKLQSLEELQI